MLFALVVAARAQDPAVMTADVLVTAASRKNSGEAWDTLGGAPDLKVCVQAVPTDEEKAIGRPPKEVCSGTGTDSFSVYFSIQRVLARQYWVTVVDADLSASDPVAVFGCAAQVGRAFDHPETVCELQQGARGSLARIVVQVPNDGRDMLE